MQASVREVATGSLDHEEVVAVKGEGVEDCDQNGLFTAVTVEIVHQEAHVRIIDDPMRFGCCLIPDGESLC